MLVISLLPRLRSIVICIIYWQNLQAKITIIIIIIIVIIIIVIITIIIIIVIIKIIIIIIIIIIIEETHSKTILENTVEIEPQTVAFDFKNLSQYSSRSK